MEDAPSAPMITSCDFRFVCPVKWDEMAGLADGSGKHCEHCQRSVVTVHTRRQFNAAAKRGAPRAGIVWRCLPRGRRSCRGSAVRRCRPSSRSSSVRSICGILRRLRRSGGGPTELGVKESRSRAAPGPVAEGEGRRYGVCFAWQAFSALPRLCVSLVEMNRRSLSLK